VQRRCGPCQQVLVDLQCVLQGSGKVARKLAAPNAPLGYALCLINLTFDGYTNAAQVSKLQSKFINVRPVQ
jgi:solute carrier family 35 (UDP-galactose transporter), member B1